MNPLTHAAHLPIVLPARQPSRRAALGLSAAVLALVLGLPAANPARAQQPLGPTGAGPVPAGVLPPRPTALEGSPPAPLSSEGGSGAVPGGAPAGVRTTSRGAAILLDQANYWSAQGRPSMALQALDRLIVLEPNNPDVLATAAEVAMQNGDRPAAEGYVARLNQMAPGSAAAQRAAAALRAADVDQAGLAEARRLAQAGQREAAMQRYREVFPNGEVPDSYAAEYYQTLASTSSENFREAQIALRAAAQRAPFNRSLQLSYAQLLTYRETTRPEGIELLAQLAQAPETASGARAAWRQALLWQGPSGEAEAQINDYLQRFPDDQEIIAKLAEIRAVTADPVAEARIRGYELLRDNKTEEAEATFNTVLETDANEPTALLGLAMVRRRQRREVDARRLLEQATAAAPDRRAEFLESLGYTEDDIRTGRGLPGYRGDAGAYAGRGGGGRGNRGGGGGNWRGQGGGRGNASIPTPPSVFARRALQANNLGEAERQAQLAARGDTGQQIESAIVQGYIAQRRGDPGTAELRFREALARRRNLPEAQAGLYGAIVQQGRYADADRWAAESGYRPDANTALVRSSALRQQAAEQQDTDSQISILRGALAAAPNDAWAAHDLARALKTRGQRAEAMRIERDLVGRRTTDAMYAAALLANQDGRAADVVARMEAIPEGSRTADGRLLLARNRTILEVQLLERQARGNPQGDAARRLLALAGRGDRDGFTQAQVIRAFGRLRQPANAAAAGQAAGAESPSTPPEARVAVAEALLDAGRLGSANPVSPAAATGTERYSTVSERRAAVDRLTPPRPEVPANVRSQLSLARVYAESGRAEEASEIAEPILSREPGNTEARAVAGAAAVARNAIGRAEEILREGRARGADELQMALLDARIARARRDQVRARAALEEAARLRTEQLRAGG
ncbi:hypothetical protein [Muricoccus radiodurans]|uniref:hypothetical protein n=1 Tax=Muricoccus radiodurans TaxID=2231721 RepID=UPI003CF57506